MTFENIGDDDAGDEREADRAGRPMGGAISRLLAWIDRKLAPSDDAPTDDGRVQLRQRTIPEQLDYLGDQLAAQIDAATVPPDALVAMGAAVIGFGRIATVLRKQAAPLTAGDFADLRAFCDTWLAELAEHGWLTRHMLLVDGSELDVGRLHAALERLATAEATLTRVTSQMQRYDQHGSRSVNVRQVLNLLSPTWPDGNYESAPEGGDRG